MPSIFSVEVVNILSFPESPSREGCSVAARANKINPVRIWNRTSSAIVRAASGRFLDLGLRCHTVLVLTSAASRK